MNKENIKTVGFSSEKEKNSLARLNPEKRRISLEKELISQLAEDFGFLQFTIKYEFDEDGDIFNPISGEKIGEIMTRGEVYEESESFRKIENGLKDNPEKTWIHFSPKNEKLGYPTNCVDFWRIVDEKIVCNRIEVKNDFGDMNRVKTFLSGEKENKDEMDMLRSPIAVNLKLGEIFSLFELNESHNCYDFDRIERVVEEYLGEFENDFGENVVEESDLIFRLYSVCFNSLKFRKDDNEVIINRKELDGYMYGVMKNLTVESSFGCSGSTNVGNFGEGTGYYVSADGKISFGKVPEGFKYCEHCHVSYSGEKCPFC